MNIQTLLNINDLDQVNTILNNMVPFNQPHELQIIQLSQNGVKALIPYIKNNMNHIGGTHACGLATVAEYVSGLAMLLNFNPEQYRLIMSKLEVAYLFQAKMDCYAHFELKVNDIEKITSDLNTAEKTLYPAAVSVNDKEGNLICQAIITWQIKKWDKVKTTV